MNNDSIDKDLLAGSRIQELREKLLLSRKSLSKATGIPLSTLARIEGGIEAYDVHNLTPICNFFGIRREDLYRREYQTPHWFDLQKKLLGLHKPGTNAYHDLFETTPKIPVAIEYRLIPDGFLDTFREVKEIKKYFSDECRWEFQSSSITNALNNLADQGKIKSKRKNTGVFLYRKA